MYGFHTSKETISNNVRDLRKLMNVTQEELSIKLSVTRQTIIAIEKGSYVPSVLLALKIAKFFNRPLEEIFKIKKYAK